MKVNGNDPAHSFSWNEKSKAMPGIPIRLEIASRILAGMWSTVEDTKVNYNQFPIHALKSADALIKAHNETSGGD